MSTILSPLLSIQFGFYSSPESERLSVCDVSLPETFDSLGHPIRSGANDLRMGPFEMSHGLCETCRCDFRQCPGHCGRISLGLPVYHPLLMNQIQRLLQCVCFQCKRLRTGRVQSEGFLVKMMLLEADLWLEAESLEGALRKKRGKGKKEGEDESLVGGLRKKRGKGKKQGEDESLEGGLRKKRGMGEKEGEGGDEAGLGGGKEAGSNEEEEEEEHETLEQYESRVDGVLREFRSMAEARIKGLGGVPARVTTHVRTAKLNLMNDLVAQAKKNNKCMTCGSKKYKIRKAGNAKLFRSRPVSKSAKRKSGSSRFVDDEAMDDDDDEEEGDELIDDEERRKTSGAEEYMPPTMVESELRALWNGPNSVLIKLYFGENCSTFFVRTILVPPNRFRPARKNDNDMIMENDQTKLVLEVLKAHEALKSRYKAANEKALLGAATTTTTTMDGEDTSPHDVNNSKQLTTLMLDWNRLQEAVNVFMDNTKTDNSRVVAASEQKDGVRQLMEKKEGLFRQNLMGKRVNFAARSVISPDPMIGTDEIGVPLKFAKELTYAEPVNEYNVERLAKCVENGPDVHPGAVYVEDASGQMFDLKHRDKKQREEIASRLRDLTRDESREDRLIRAQKEARKGDSAHEASSFNRVRSEARTAAHALGGIIKVWRHLHNGDVVLANRQPTLHKASIMAHRVRVINHPQMQTIRLHYANCYTYNADFDGDEINLHFPQNELARAEAYEIAYTNQQYVAPTDGTPMRGLIQDHIAMGVLLSQRDTFFERDQYIQLLYSSDPTGSKLQENYMVIPPPAAQLRGGKKLWSGKQLISSVLKRVVPGVSRRKFSMQGSKSKTPSAAFLKRPAAKDAGEAWGAEGLLSESQVRFRSGDMMAGILDKNSFGNSSKYGFVHCIFEAFGATAAGDLLTALGRLFTECERFWGHSCGIDDLLLTLDAEAARLKIIKDGEDAGVLRSLMFARGVGGDEKAQQELQESDPFKDVTKPQNVSKIRELLSNCITSSMDSKAEEGAWDGVMGGVTSKIQSEVMKACVPFGQQKRFPENAFSLMVMTGAKGSNVNQAQISCMLGQQALEGKRVPRMSSGKTLPCFEPFDPSPRAGGFVTNRFLSGIRPQEYYFHCMAGREGLLDTAVKTARSGYLQRCMVKHLEHLKVAYDRTVRADDGSVVQFAYGDDGLDAMNVPFLQGTDETFKFLYDNKESFVPSQEYMDFIGVNKISKQVHEASYESGKRGFGYDRVWVKGDAVTCFGKAGEITKVRESDNEVDILGEDGVKQKHVAMSNVYPQDPVFTRFNPDTTLGSVVESLDLKMREYCRRDPFGDFQNDEEKIEEFKTLVYAKYAKSLVAPGEAVGVLSAQGIGEPSTQMTLNTFHLAGHAEKNVTLGIPRLRELLWARAPGKTPTIRMECASFEAASKIASRLCRIRLSDIILSDGGVVCREIMVRRSLGKIGLGPEAIKQLHEEGPGTGEWSRRYLVQYKLYPLSELKEEFGLSLKTIAKVVAKKLASKFCQSVQKELKRSSKIVEGGKVSDSAARRRGGDDGEEDPVQAEDVEEEDDVIVGGEEDDDGVGSAAGGDSSDEDEDEGSKSVVKVRGKKRVKFAPNSGNQEEDEEEKSEEMADGAGSVSGSGEKKKGKSGDAVEAGDDVMEEDDEDDEDAADAFDSKSPKKKSSFNSKDPKVVDCDCKYNYLLNVSCAGGKDPYVQIALEFPASFNRLLLVDLAEDLAQSCAIRQVEGILDAIAETQDDKHYVHVSGASSNKFNIKTMWKCSEKGADFATLDCNDVQAVLNTFGVEAARACLIKQFKAVFDPYGIDIDERHLSLVADHMVYEGDFKAMNRYGIEFSTSPFVRITFETAVKMVMNAALLREKDDLDTPSARIATGQVIRSGTGAVALVIKPVKERF